MKTHSMWSRSDLTLSLVLNSGDDTGKGLGGLIHTDFQK